MNIDLTEWQTNMLSRLAGAGIVAEFRQFAARINGLADMAPPSLNEILNDDFLEAAASELSNYNALLTDLIALFEKFNGQTQASSFYAKRLAEIELVCDDMDTARVNGKFFD